MMEVEVVDIRKASADGKFKAFAAVKFGGSLTVKGFSVMKGIHGIFVKVPNTPTKDGRWLDTVVVDSLLKQAIKSKVIEAYDKEIDGVDS